MMYALSTIVQQHASIRHFFDVTTDDNLTMILHEFLPFGIEQYIFFFPQTMIRELSAEFILTILMIHLYSKLNYLTCSCCIYTIRFSCVHLFSMIVKLIFSGIMIYANAYGDAINNTRQHARIFNWSNRQSRCIAYSIRLKLFSVDDYFDIHIDSYFPIKHPFEQALYQTYLIDMTSIDMASLAVSVYLANHIMSQQRDA